MTTVYIHRLIVFVEWSKLTPANAVFASPAVSDGDTGGGDTFGRVRLSADGNEPPTHSVCGISATDTMNTGILNALGMVPWAGLYDEGETYVAALTDMGLQVIE